MNGRDDIQLDQPSRTVGLESRWSKGSRGVPWSVLGAVLGAFVLGSATVLFWQNAAGGENLTFSTVGLLTFLFSIALASTSIVLSVTAIGLGKASEQAMIARSDESIRLQNDIFVRTTDALQRIESSTGVTEKRLEDVISGRAGLISQRVAQRAVSDKLITDRARKQLERELTDSIRGELSDTIEREVTEAGGKSSQRAAQERAELRARYLEFKQAVLLQMANTAGVRSEKFGDGAYGASGGGLVDGVFSVDGLRVGISTFLIHPSFAEDWLQGFTDYVRRLAQEVAEGRFAHVFLAFDGDVSSEDGFGAQFRSCVGLMRDELAEKLHLVSGTPEQIQSRIIDALGPRQSEVPSEQKHHRTQMSEPAKE